MSSSEGWSMSASSSPESVSASFSAFSNYRLRLVNGNNGTGVGETCSSGPFSEAARSAMSSTHKSLEPLTSEKSDQTISCLLKTKFNSTTHVNTTNTLNSLNQSNNNQSNKQLTPYNFSQSLHLCNTMRS